LFNNRKKWNALRFLNSYGLKRYEARRLKKSFGDEIVYKRPF